MKNILLIISLVIAISAIVGTRAIAKTGPLLSQVQTVIPRLENIDTVMYKYSCNNPNIIYFVTGLDDDDERTIIVADLLVEKGTCFFSDISIASQVKNMLGIFERDGNRYYMLEVYGPEERLHFIVIEDR